MASWKVNGVVLDSDDEEESLDSQESLDDEPISTEFHHDTAEALRDNSFTDSEDELAKDGYDLRITRETGLVNTVRRDSGKEPIQQRELPSKSAGIPASGNISVDDGETSGLQGLKVKRSKKGIIPRGESSQGVSPIANRVFKIYPEFLGQEEREDSVISSGNSNGKSIDRGTSSLSLPELNNVEVDEISKSYVEISSPLSSPPFSLSNGSPGRKNPRPDPRTESIPSSPGLVPSNSGTEIPNHENVVPIDTLPSNPAPRRAFRERKLIQRHPFTVEMGQYRKTLHGAGIRAITINEEEEQKRRREAEDSQDQPFEEDEDSQLVDFMVEQPSSQPQPVFDEDSDDPFRTFDIERELTVNVPREISDNEDDPFHPLSNNIRRRNEYISSRNSDIDEDSESHRRRVSDDDEDSDDLPNIRQILEGKARSSIQRNGKRKKPQTYKTNRTIISAPSAQNEADIYDLPLSPPITSPTPYSETVRRILNRVSSLGSKRSSPLTGPRVDSPRGSEIPTPVHSTGRPSDDVIILESDSENEDHRSMTETSRSFSPEPEDRIRRVAKRIRGVLPASWLRLDQQPKPLAPPQPRIRESESASPQKNVPQRGVAIRKPARESHQAPNPYFLEEESESEDENVGGFPARVNSETFAAPASQFGQSLAGSLFDDAIEDNQIDRMLPSRKRSLAGLSSRPSKKRRVPNKLFYGTRQPKITEQFDRARNSPAHAKRSRTTDNQAGHRVKRRKTTAKQPTIKAIPAKLSILDVVDPASQAFIDAPPFIKIAIRTARSRRQLGRHSPSRKFVRLDNIDDTNDAQSVLRQWREGTILPNKSLRYSEALPMSARQWQSRDQQATTTPQCQSERASTPDPRLYGRTSRTLVLSKARQTTLDGVVQSIEIQPPHPMSHNSLPATHLPRLRTNKQLLNHRPYAKPAQLETEEREYNRSHPNASFGTTKKGLDRLYRRAHRGAAVKGDVQLARFLADPDAIGSVVHDISYQTDVPHIGPDIVEIPAHQPNRRRKKSPRHLDAGAHRYRQPSEPLPLGNYFTPLDTNVDTTSDAGKVLNLQPYGTRYTYHFDIFPLQFGIYFHESTFIGSGRLSRVLDASSKNRDYSIPCMACVYFLDEKQLQWAEWNATVSSEMGLCFDWISGQLEGVESTGTNVVELIDFTQKYLEQHLFFAHQDHQKQFIRRVYEIIDGFLARACPESFQACTNGTSFQQTVQTLTRLLTMLMQLFRMCQQPDNDSILGREVEDLLQRTSERLAALLTSFGVDKVRSFYEECQYLSSRETGIRENRYYIEAWVVMMKVMQAAKIPRSSFWDIVNKSLLKGNLNAVNDAQVFECIWYNMFTLIPLAEFTYEGVIRPGLRHTLCFENWALPQTLMKKIFAMYALKSRQSAGFNDYVRCLFVRCHHLMAQWGWRRCGSLIGTLFDFFAHHDLAHLRNEESFSSPRFLEELNTEPSLSVEADDKCFHIFLKIVATSIKDMHQAGDVKGIRNLVARLLPNHGRQYPKEEVIHQRDLASLRNHHDLLCTLFWAAPIDLRPSVTLFQQLVVPERSHKEACLINLRSWSNLARFLLATSPVPKEYQQLVEWEQNVFSSLVHRYQTAEEDIRQQHAALSDVLQRQHSEQSISLTIEKNQEQVVEEINCHLRAIILQMKSSKDIEAAKTIFMAGRPLVTSVLGLFGSKLSGNGRVALEATFQFVDSYFLKTEQYQQSLPDLDHEEREAMVLGRAGCLSVFDDNKLFSVLEKMVLQMLEKKLDRINERLIIEVWAKVSACQARREDFFKNNITILHTRVGEWISGHAYPASGTRQAQMCAPLFMAAFIQQVPERVLKRALAQRNLFQEWLCSIVKPPEQFRFEYFFTLSIVKAHLLPRSLLRDQKSYLPRHIITLDLYNGAQSLFDESTEENKIGLINLKKDQFLVIEGVLKYLSDTHKGLSTKPDGLQNRRHLADILKALMIRLKENYVSTCEIKTTSSINHQQLIRRIVSSIKTYAIDVCPLDKFFTEPDTIYYHSAADGPNFFVPTMINYGLHILDPGVEQKLLYYCWGSIKGMVQRQECEKLPGLLLQVMRFDLKSNDLVMGATKTIITSLAPAALWAAWQTNEGFIIADIFLGAVEEQVLVLASIDIGMAAETVLPVFRTILLGLWALHASDIISISRPHLYLAAKAISFIMSLRHILMMASMSHSDLSALLQQFASFTKAAEKYYEDKQLISGDARFHGNAPRVKNMVEPSFGKVMRDEYAQHWEYRNGSVWVKMGSGQRAMSVSSYSATGETLVRGATGDDALASEERLVDELLSTLRVYNELLDDGQERMKRDLARAVIGLESIWL